MKESSNQAPQMPPDVVSYLKGAPPESLQFDFLIGDWDVAAARYKEDGSVLFEYKASWSARYLHEGRMVMDDFKAYLPTGQEMSSYVTLRTYSEATHCWEMTGLSALQPAITAHWRGEWKDGEMLIDVIGKNPEGDTIRNNIRFFNISKDRFAWESKISQDAGKTWTKAASLFVSRVSR